MGESFGGLLALGTALETTNRPEAPEATANLYVRAYSVIWPVVWVLCWAVSLDVCRSLSHTPITSTYTTGRASSS